MLSDYYPRVVDVELDRALARAGAVLVEGPKASGKTATAQQRARSVVHVDTDPAVAAQMAVDPSLVLEGETPRLLDEWQLQPKLWDVVRRTVDERRDRGQFILTGSTAPAGSARRHSGAGRFARLRMRTLTFAESGHSEGAVSLAALLEGEAPRSGGGDFGLDDLLQRIARGGWPSDIGLDLGEALERNRDYVAAIVDVDVHQVEGRRDPLRVGRLLSALARSVATEVTISTLARDEASLSRDAVREYLDALSRIFVVEDQPAWSAHLRSSATLRKEPKRHLCDPSLAVAALGADAQALRRNLGFAGQLFESQAVHDLRVFAQPLRAQVFHARDSVGREVDAIVQHADGRWAAFEIKLGSSEETVNEAAANLRAFAGNVEHDSAGSPVLTVITGFGASYRRADGVNVVALPSLGV